MHDLVLQELSEGLLTITLNVPDRRNALTVEIALLLRKAVRDASINQAVRGVLLQGSGGYFCVGGDVKGMGALAAPPTVEEKVATLSQTTETARILHEMPKPVVAAIDGAAAGAGLSIALACDFRIVGETAKISTAFTKIGLSSDYGGPYFVTKMLGSAKARELYLLPSVLSGADAAALGIMTRAVPDAQVHSAAHALAMSLAQGPTVALGYTKKNINNAEHFSLASCLEGEALHQSRCLQTDDHKEAAAAFLQKRPPLFKGR